MTKQLMDMDFWRTHSSALFSPEILQNLKRRLVLEQL